MKQKLIGTMDEKLNTHLLILYASETGNAIDAAEQVGREAERRGCPYVSVLSVDEFHPSDLPEKKTVIFVVSTTGQGDAPDSMKGFWRFLLQKNLSQGWLKGVRYAVFGLGDSSYQKYNFVAKKLDKRLLDLGALAIIERGLGDDQHPSGYEGALDLWMSSLWNILYQTNPKLLPNGPGFVNPDAALIDLPRAQIIYHDTNEGVPPLSNATDLKYLEIQVERARSMTPSVPYGKNRPDCFLKMTKNLRLSRDGSGKDVRHFEFEAVSSSIVYEVGDVLEILPGQSSTAVDAFIQRCNLNPESCITVCSSPFEIFFGFFSLMKIFFSVFLVPISQNIILILSPLDCSFCTFFYILFNHQLSIHVTHGRLDSGIGYHDKLLLGALSK